MLREKVARVFREILLDEVGHKETGARALAAVVRPKPGLSEPPELLLKSPASVCACATSSSVFR